MAYDLAVTYTILHIGRRDFFSYRDGLYTTKNDMTKDIILDHAKISTDKLLLLCVGKFTKNTEHIDPHQYIYENPLPVFAKKSLSAVIVHEYYKDGIITYTCLNKKFARFKKARSYAIKMNFKLFFHPKKQKKVKVPDYMNILKMVKRFSFSGRIWYGVWGSCYYYGCFAANDFTQLKLRYLNEINQYRYEHGAKVIKISNYSTKLAEKYLHTILSVKPKLLDRSLLHNYVRLPFYLAPLAIKNWYGEHKKYNYETKVAITGTEHFTSIVWKSVKYMGLAVEERDDIIHLVFVFYPQPNMPKFFQTNVLKRRIVNIG